MTKDAKAQSVTIALIAAALILVAWKQGAFDAMRRSVEGGAALFGAGSSREEEPRDVIYAMLDAARDGLADDYLDCYTDPLGRTLRQSYEEMGAERFSEFLRERNKDIKGIAMNAPEEAGENVQVRVEYVYVDRNEAQEFFLLRSGDSWKITRVSDIRRVETPVPYGTPVY